MGSVPFSAALGQPLVNVVQIDAGILVMSLFELRQITG